MHAGGHDVHLAALVALARSARRMRLPFAIAPVFQPREESYPSRALDMVEEGFWRASGSIKAAADEVEITLIGVVGHGAYPQHATDPVTALAHLILGLPDVVRRTISAMEPATVTVSVGTVTAADGAANVLPDRARL